MLGEDDLSTEIAALGTLIGMLTQDGDSVTIDTDWFKNPIDALTKIPDRIDCLVTLLDMLMGPGVSVTGFSGLQWYPIPDIIGGTDTVFHIVASQGSPSSGQIGCGMRYSLTTDGLTYSVFIYIPLLSYSPSGTQLIIGAVQEPCQIGLSVNAADKFQVGAVTFTAMTVSASIYFAAETSTVSVDFTDLSGTDKKGPFITLSELLDSDVEGWIGQVIVQGSTWLDLTIGDSCISVGDILAVSAFLTRDDEGNYHLNLTKLQGLSATQIAQNFVFGALNALSESDEPLAIIELPGGGVYVARRNLEGGGSDYGLRLALDIPLMMNQNSNGKPSPAVNLSFGSWLTGEDDIDNWVERSKSGSLTEVQDPGISVFMLRQDVNTDIAFAPSFALSSVGINIAGGANTALIDLNGYTLQGGEIRAYLDSVGWIYGFAGRFDGLGFPLGPAFGSAVSDSSSNPVAQSLLSSGSDAGSGDQSSVNPAFSVTGGYMRDGSFVVQLFDKNDKPSDEVIIPIQRTLGPLRAEKLGISWIQSNALLSLLFDGSISLAELSVDLMGLSIGVPLASPSDFSKYELDLNGLGMTLAANEVELSAALIKRGPDPMATPPRNYIEYDGEALLKAANFSIQAFGSYAYVPGPSNGQGYASLFIFGILDANLGGPAFFYVTGLAAGFGYNRALILPDQNSVTQFPLVAGANDPAVLGGQKQEDGSWLMPAPATALEHLDQYVPPQRGEYWLAAGVRFTSFDLINSTALLTVEFGDELEIALLALTWMSLPPPSAPGASAPSVQYAYGELGIEIKLLPSEGIFSATGILTPNSFVLDPACQLTGGFAFYTWFGSNPHAGEFVLTLGGYHPNFNPPSYYPRVPKLGFNWSVTDAVSISGDAYFALTPSAVMVGAGLQVLYSSGDLQAWFKAQMDMLIEWAPFYYDIKISISVGASYKLKLLCITTTLKIELGADLTLWGPPMGGEARVNWSVISFTIYFGASYNNAPDPLDWTNDNGTGFAQTLLPHQTQSGQVDQLVEGLAEVIVPGVEASTSIQPSGIYTISVNDGLLKTFTHGSDTIWVVRSNHFVFSAITTIPSTEVDITPTNDGTMTTITAERFSPAGKYCVAIRPMSVTLCSSVFTITLNDNDSDSIYDLASKFNYDVALSSVPAAKWGMPNDTLEPNVLLPGRLMGLQHITPKMPTLTPNDNSILDIDVVSALCYDVVDGEQPYNPNHLPLQPNLTPALPTPQVSTTSLQQIQATLMQPAQISARAALFVALRGYGIDPGTNGDLTSIAADPGAYLTGCPLIY